MSNQELIAAALYTKWSEEAGAKPNWAAYYNDKPLNQSERLRRDDFMKEAETLLQMMIERT
jgi:hypothetical protein